MKYQDYKMHKGLCVTDMLNVKFQEWVHKNQFYESPPFIFGSPPGVPFLPLCDMTANLKPAQRAGDESSLSGYSRAFIRFVKWIKMRIIFIDCVCFIF